MFNVKASWFYNKNFCLHGRNDSINIRRQTPAKKNIKRTTAAFLADDKLNQRHQLGKCIVKQTFQQHEKLKKKKNLNFFDCSKSSIKERQESHK